jgi:hypothetical protein
MLVRRCSHRGAILRLGKSFGERSQDWAHQGKYRPKRTVCRLECPDCHTVLMAELKIDVPATDIVQRAHKSPPLGEEG